MHRTRITNELDRGNRLSPEECHLASGAHRAGIWGQRAMGGFDWIDRQCLAALDMSRINLDRRRTRSTVRGQRDLQCPATLEDRKLRRFERKRRFGRRGL